MRLPSIVAAASCVAAMSIAGCQPVADQPSAKAAPVVGVATPDPHVQSPQTPRHVVRHRQRHHRGDVFVNGGRVVLPNSGRTPGAVNPAVTQQTIRSTICRTGYTSTIRPPSGYTTSLKVQQLDSGYAFRGDVSTYDYEEDHLIALELGGAPSNPRNLWPEPYATGAGAKTKDLLENQLHDLVCSGRLSLRVAQRAIATNWWQAYQRYGGRGVPEVYVGAYGGSTTSTSTGSTSTSGATAKCVDGTLSYSAHRSGTCSHHGGVAEWINPPPS
ncbi:MAG TPA: DUF3761 domain-containing protein [Mycobacteriales bacterium]|nr:DUF3761 domain-containing protein [Mycobacteriales bacterium]